MTAESKSKLDPHKITPKQTKPNSKKKVRDLTDLFGGKLGSIGKNKVDGELARDGRWSSWARLHKGDRGLWGINVWDHFLPGFNEV